MQFAQYTIEISAPAQRVWDVLTLTRYIREWDDVPAEFTGDRVALGVALTWPGHATLTYTVLEAPVRLYADLHVAKWTRPPEGPVGYEYVVTPTAHGSRLDLRVGDFTHVPDGAELREASDEFVVTAAAAIKRLAESGA
jgi:uncharacterized protein YndB with AHSA1/START domain